MSAAIALIMALFVLAILSLVGITYMTSSTLETKINSNSRNAYPAFYAAEAGLEEATYRLMGTAINPIALSFVGCSNQGGLHPSEQQHRTRLIVPAVTTIPSTRARIFPQSPMRPRTSQRISCPING